MGADLSKIVDDVQHCNCYGGAAPEDTLTEERVEQSSSQLAELAVAASHLPPPQELREEVAPEKTPSQQSQEDQPAAQQVSSELAAASESARAEMPRSSEEIHRKTSQVSSQRSTNRIEGIRRALSGQVAAMAGKVMPKRESSAKFSKKESSGQLSVQSSSSAAAAAEQRQAVRMGPVDMDMILADPEAAGEAIYPRVFVGLAGDSDALEPDHKDLRDFVMKHSGVSEDDLDTEILKAASCREDFLIDRASFTKLMQEHPLAEADALNIFLGMSSDGETMTSEDCRTGLLRLLEQLPDVKGRSEAIFDAVMASAGLAVPMDQWMSFATKTARIARLMPLAERADSSSRKQLGAKVDQQPSNTRRSAARAGGA